MNTLWHKVWADLWLHPGRTFLVILSLSAGLFCIGTLYGMLDMQLNRMDQAHRNSEPAHINLILGKPINEKLLQRIRSLPGVANLEAVNQFPTRFRVSTEHSWQTANLLIRTVPKRQLFDKVQLETGNWPQNDYIAIERLSAQSSQLGLSDTLEFETPQGFEVMTIGSTVRHPFVKPPAFGGQLHFLIAPSQSARFGIPADYFRQLLIRIEPPYSLEKSRRVTHQIRSLLNEVHIAVNISLLQDPTSHWGRRFVAGINIILQIMAVTSLILAGVLVFNIITNHIYQQSRQIGIMKAIGGKTANITGIYLKEILIMGLIAILFALPLSQIAAYLSACHVLNLFNIDCGQWSYSNTAVMYSISGGLLVPVLAALPPIFLGCTRPLRQVLAFTHERKNTDTNYFDRWIDQIGDKLLANWLPTLYAAALGNVFRAKTRLILTQIVLIISGIMFLILMTLIDSLHLTLNNEMARHRYSVKLGMEQEQSIQEINTIMRSQAETGEIETWRRQAIEIVKNKKAVKQKGSLGLQMISLPASSRFFRPLITSGRWFTPNDNKQNRIVINAETAVMNEIAVGDFVTVQLLGKKQQWQVIGFYRWLAGSNFTIEPVYSPLQTLNKYIKDTNLATFALVSASIESYNQEQDYLQRIIDSFRNHAISLNVYTTHGRLEQRRFAFNQFKPVIMTLLGLAVMIAVVSAAGLSGTLLIGVLQRIREIGVLYAIGASERTVFRLFMLEGLFHGLLAWSISSILAFLHADKAANLLGQTMLNMQLDYVFKPVNLVYWAVIILIITTFASYWPARKASKQSIQQCLNHN